MKTQVFFLGWILALSFVCGVGCGPNAEAQLNNDLKQIGLAYVTHCDQHKQGPADWDELKKYCVETKISPESVDRVRAAGFELKGGLKMSGQTKPLSEIPIVEKAGSAKKVMLDGSLH